MPDLVSGDWWNFLPVLTLCFLAVRVGWGKPGKPGGLAEAGGSRPPIRPDGAPEGKSPSPARPGPASKAC